MTASSRNQPCPCGSGKKYKHCCANRTSPPTSVINQSEQEILNPRAALQLAMQHHQAGRLREAEMLYQQVLQIQPDHPDTLHLLGVVNHQLGNNDLAYTLISKAVKQMPDTVHFINNLGEVCRAQNKLDEAQACYEKVLVIQPAHAEAHRNLGLVYLALGLALSSQGQTDEAIARYDMALTLSPNDPALLCAKGVALKLKGDLDKTIQHYQHALTLQPAVPEFHHNLALTYQSLGKLAEAETCFEKTLELQPSNEMAKHLLAALKNITTDRAPASYVRDTFDSYAEKFDTHLVNHLKYRTPEMLAALIQNKLNPEHQALNVLDLGCGTGLFGEHVKHIKKQLIGIDLSSKMIAKAKNRGIYDELIVGDLLDYMSTATASQFNLIVATDVFNYVGNLLTVFQQASKLLCEGSWFAFSLEAAGDDASNFVLDKTGRYKHGRMYVPHLCEQFGFEESGFAQSTLRMDGNTPVVGYLYLLKKSRQIDFDHSVPKNWQA